MFDRLRNKFYSVHENLTASIRGLSVNDSTNRNQFVKLGQEINLDAGTNVLEHYQMCWAELHEAAQENATKAQEVDRVIGKLHKNLQKQSRDVGQIGTILARLPEVIHSVNELTERIVTLESLFDAVERALIQFEDLIELRELQDRQLDHRFQLTMYKEKKLKMLEQFRVQVTMEHAEKIQRQQRLMKERQDGFEEQFRQDMEAYKETNTITRVRKPVDNSKAGNKYEESRMDEIKLDSDDRALDEFLRDTTPEAN